ncbi:MAG: archaeosine synthase subunit alpha [Methanomicrobiales archaeon]|nr:archaeosine synthase subunit alpha [Methanomicrobiales archaeon]
MSVVDIRKRDGLARTGFFAYRGEKKAFPNALDMLEAFPSLRERALSHVPLAVDPEFVRTWHRRGEEEPFSLHPLTVSDIPHGSCVMVPGWHTALANPSAYVDWLVALKEQVPPDTLWYAPAAALPGTAAILLYSGFDLFDFTGTDLKSAQNLFCTSEGIFPGEWLEKGLCGCEGCQEGDLRLHNRKALQQELALGSQFIAGGNLRELVEARCRMDAHQVAILRNLDTRFGFLEPRSPIVRSIPFLANSGDALSRVEVKRFAERVITRYRPPAADVALLLPCSARKPYSLSRSHRKFHAVVGRRAHELMITSPLGLVPRELEHLYPAAHYDVPVTGYWDREELHWVSSVLAEYLRRHSYRRIIAHLEGGALTAAEMAAEQCGVPLECTCTGPTGSKESLEALDRALKGERRVPETALIRGILSWQFDVEIDLRGMRLRSRGPEIYVMQDKEQLFSLSPDTGLFTPTFAGWRLLGEGYRVQIDRFIPKGDILAPGVVSADDRIREGDEVFVTGEGVRATGRAAMGAAEMLSSARGVAVRVRKVLKG